MKKNLVSILILALLLVNVVLTAVMMFSTMSSVKKTGALVTDIASVLHIELDDGQTEGEENATVQISDVVTHDVPDRLTIPLRKGADGKDHFYLVDVSIWMNTKHEDYETYGATIASYDSVFKSIIVEVIGSHTLEEAQENPDGMCNEICERIQNTFGSKFVHKVVFSYIMYQ